MSQCHDQYDIVSYEMSKSEPVTGAPCHDAVTEPAGGQCPELALARTVNEWAETLAPGDEAAAGVAVRAAMYALAAGASFPEACESARILVRSRLRHPSRLTHSVYALAN